jgi:triacylglycerol lipase
MGQPLDNQAATFYGQFVQAAYAMFQTPNSTDPLRPEPSGIPPTYELGAWIQMSDFLFFSKEPKFYGIVAHKVGDPDSRIVAIRGTEGWKEWVDDAFTELVHFSQVPSAGRVAAGFDRIYSSMKVVKYDPPAVRALTAGSEPETFAGSFAEQLEQLAISREAERGVAPALAEGRGRVQRPTIVTGHSLGSALATLFVMENDSKRKFDISRLCTFASPRVGNKEFVQQFNRLPIDSWRIVNTEDLVPKVPFTIPIFFDYEQVDVAYPFDSAAFARNNLACNHSMDTYLHWLDPAHQVLPDCAP